MKTNKMTVKEQVIANVRETKMPTEGHTRTELFRAWISNGKIKVRVTANDSCEEMLLNEFTVAL